MAADFILANESAIRVGIFVLAFVGMAIWETKRPRLPSVVPRWLRWANNLALAFLGTLLVRLAFPAAAVGFAVLAEARSAGLLRMMTLQPLLATLLGVVLLDLAIFFQHVLFHSVPVLWRFHRVHHADQEFDVTTAMRFHPVELLLSMAIKGLAIVALGPPVLAVMIFEVLLNAFSIFSHANVRLPPRLDRALRLAIVTPDMHRIHHSMQPEETNSNFGFNLSVWDRLLGSYRSRAILSPEAMLVGLREFRGPAITVKLLGMLKLPFISRSRPE